MGDALKSLRDFAPIASVLLIVALVSAGAAAAIFIPIANGIGSRIDNQSTEIRTSIDQIAQKAYENQGGMQILSWGFDNHEKRLKILEDTLRSSSKSVGTEIE